MSATGPGSPRFWAGPLRYLKWAARERPAYFWSCVIAGCGPAMLITVPPYRRWRGYEIPATVPMTYPVPAGPRKKLTGYDDDTEDSI
ncbi:hypothetical protein QBC34DRAFT_376365 [Podospora aff. communis PSN243]|uniref:NADH-ubiquinone oxidoreductase 9.5 kDa subunit n=1 Tax=Podospora aff. communis PSN243 TaxID=3040156 RepID=A0AAV9GYH4_9PEZI|nr:hypothetical protein QBC34DRAFT_376365 [Podospora aff. communis PSN243]